MKKSETIQIITLLAGNYDSIAKKDEQQKALMINTWQECLGDLDYKIVLQAVKKSIIDSPYPPTIHEIRKNAIEMLDSSAKMTAIEAWNEAYKMICNGIYMTEEQFNMASPIVKSFFGNVRQVSELAKSDVNVINTVTKGQFLKQFEMLSQREQEQKMLPNSMKNIIEELSQKTDIKQLNA